jgi:hypothetical protein
MRHLRILTARRIVMLVGLSALGCDTVEDLVDEEQPPADITLEIADETVVADLTPMEQAEICTALFNAVDGQVPASTKCVLVGIAGSSVDGAPETDRCEELKTTCIPAARIGEAVLPPVSFQECGLFQGDTSGCQTSVADLRACLNLMADAAADTIEQALTCSLIDVADGMLPDLDFPSPEVPPGAEECARIQLDCPGVFMGDMPAERSEE